jgi:hypothetical protein
MDIYCPGLSNVLFAGGLALTGLTPENGDESPFYCPDLGNYNNSEYQPG